MNELDCNLNGDLWCTRHVFCDTNLSMARDGVHWPPMSVPEADWSKGFSAWIDRIETWRGGFKAQAIPQDNLRAFGEGMMRGLQAHRRETADLEHQS